MRQSGTVWLFVLCATVSYGQLTMDQKLSDFQEVAGIYAKNYGPYEWKRDNLGVDLLNVSPWLDKIRATKDDLDFYEVMVSYVAQLNDAHDVYTLPSAFVARLNFGVDIYDGKLIVDTVNRNRLPTPEFPFLIGYELVSIDGVDAQKILDGLLQYEVAANPRSTRRLSAQLLTIRPQQLMPHAASVPNISVVIFRRPDGNLETYQIPWTKSGLPLTSIGKYPSPSSSIKRPHANDVVGDEDPPADPDPVPLYLQTLAKLQNVRITDKEVLGFGAQAPIFAASLPSSFVQRFGKSPLDIFYSGVFQAGGFKIGYIRIPDFAPFDVTTGINNFLKEITFFQANTDGLIVDDMRNPGGSVSYVNTLVSLLMTSKWRSIPFEVRATPQWVVSISSSLEQAKALGADQTTIDLLQGIKTEIVAANHAMRGRTKPIPIDDVNIDRDPALDSRGKVLSYTKPLMILIDEMSASGGDAFPATIQDNARGILFGWRTMGAGGNVVNIEAGSYSLGSTRVTQSLMNRKNPIVTSEYATAPYVENIGVRPDITNDYMTIDNLTMNGQPFVDAFVAAMVDYIQKNK
jgi:hypothetical protein